MMIAKLTVLRQLLFGMACCLLVTTTGQAWAQAKPSVPATVAEARKLLDLTKLPHFKGAMPPDPDNYKWCVVEYDVPAAPKPVYDFHRKQLIAQKWKEVKSTPGPLGISHSGLFQKDGFAVILNASSLQAGTTSLSIENYGNVDLTKFAFPVGKKVPDRSRFELVEYETPTPQPEAYKAAMKYLKDKGWQPFGADKSSMAFIQNGVRLSVLFYDKEKPGDKTSFSLQVSLLSVELPAMPDVTKLEFYWQDSLVILKFDTKAKPAAVAEFYIKSLAKTGWKPKETALKKGESEETMTFENPQHDTVELKVTTDEGSTHVELNHTTGTPPPDDKGS